MKTWYDYFARLGFDYTYLGVKVRGENGMKELEKRVSSCTACPLHELRNNTVFGEGDPNARIVFVGEAPGADEDRQGIPFVGRAGKLLTKMIQAMGLTRDEIYICNILKCRPPGNRDPEPAEIEQCIPYLHEQLDYIQPEVIVGLGRISSQILSGSSTPITRMRGHWHVFHDIPLMPTYHPSYLLRQPGRKGEVWEDLKEVLRRLNLPIPER